MKQFQRNLIILLLIFLSLGALFGGVALIISPSGELIQMPVSMLEPSPFNDFLIPGIILFIVFGVFPLIISYALLYKPKSKIANLLNIFSDMHWAWTYTIYIGFGIIIWIQMQMVFIDDVHWAHTTYVFWGIAILLLALLPKVRGMYKKASLV